MSSSRLDDFTTAQTAATKRRFGLIRKKMSFLLLRNSWAQFGTCRKSTHADVVQALVGRACLNTRAAV